MKKVIMMLKWKFIRKNAPSEFLHWNESKSKINFHGINKPVFIVKKPLWLIVAERYLYD